MNDIKITSGLVPSPRRIVLYGVHGIGKSTFGASSWAPIFAPTEDGQNDIDCDRLPLAKSHDQLMNNLQWVYEADHRYETLVLDSLDWYERLAVAEVCAAHRKTNIEDIGYAKGWVFALDWWRQLIAALDAIREKRGMAIICIAHAQIVRFEDPEMESYDRYVPCLNKHASSLVSQWADELLFATYKVYAGKTEEKFSQKRVIPTGGQERIIKTTEKPSHAAKNRLGLPDEIPLSWETFETYLPPRRPTQGAKAPEKAKAAKQNGKPAAVEAGAQKTAKTEAQ